MRILLFATDPGDGRHGSARRAANANLHHAAFAKGGRRRSALSPAGAAEAQELASLLGGSGTITAIFATQTQRAMDTAAPLAKRLGLAVTPYDPDAPQNLVETVKAMHGAVLIVGHSNTVPDLVIRFGGVPAPVIGDEDYGTIFIVNPATHQVRQMELTPAK